MSFQALRAFIAIAKRASAIFDWYDPAVTGKEDCAVFLLHVHSHGTTDSVDPKICFTW